MRAVKEFDLLKEGDKVLAGFSGGKDSSFLLYALSVLREYGPVKFKLGAVTIDQGFSEPLNPAPIRQFCRDLEVPHYLEDTKIALMSFTGGKQNPCARCAFFRRDALAKAALREGYNKLALAHHLDDAVETFLISQLYSGQLRTFLPKTYMERTGLVVIRPLVYLREKEIKGLQAKLGFKPVPSTCPLNARTKREEVKELIKELTRKNPQVFFNLVSAMREGKPKELWPPPAPQVGI